MVPQKLRRRLALFAVALTTITTGVLVTAAPAQAAECNNQFTFASLANGKLVSAEYSASGNMYGFLRARADKAGPWEKFTLCKHTNYFTIQSNHTGLYVSVELSHPTYNGVLRARASAVGPWERLSKENIGNGWHYVLSSQANNKYVSAEVDWSGSVKGLLRARAESKGNWEVFGL
ncbi:fascin domain-containing protein [Micromonospora arida]|uniref:fascin domain-containing protein n=1 Tax=Micromonospora arida TaxID=2203715 RepID=UPI0033A96CB4